jgi:hypothetical protein
VLCPEFEYARVFAYHLMQDILLMKSVEQCGLHNWESVSKNVPGRTANQCINRYRRQLNPELKKGKWTAEEVK